MSEEMISRKFQLSSFQIIILGFAGVILLGALLLMLPIATQEGCTTPFNEALFTATSAVCVTGLVIHDTGSYWSAFGQTIILTLIQIGGLGVVTVAASFALLSRRRISLMQRTTLQDAISAPNVGGIVRLTKFILWGTFLIELLGTLAMLPVFCHDYGWHGIWLATFHSISAFCNAGFDILGTADNIYPSLTGYAQNPMMNITIMLLIIIGGIGFLTWEDICENKLQFRRYRMQSKVILIFTLILIIFPAIFFFFADFASLPMEARLQASLFQSVTTRTAGFNTANLSAMSSSSRVGSNSFAILASASVVFSSAAVSASVAASNAICITSFFADWQDLSSPADLLLYIIDKYRGPGHPRSQGLPAPERPCAASPPPPPSPGTP